LANQLRTESACPAIQAFPSILLPFCFSQADTPR
jgi:hypothetical protein